MNVTLELRYCKASQRAAAAWLIPGGDPRRGWPR